MALRLGVPTATLRSWSQRYGLGPDGHRRGRHRLYSEADIAVLSQMVDLVESGVSPASAAENLRSRLHRLEAVPAVEDSVQLALLARSLDTGAMSDLLDRSLRQRGVIPTWSEVCLPAFSAVASRQVDGSCIDEEHALSWAVSSSLRQAARVVGGPRRARILLACTAGEHHLLALEALAAALAERATPVSMLGSDVPVVALRDAVERTRPAALVLWSHAAATADPDAVAVGQSFADQVYVAGPGWPEGAQGVGYLHGLDEACDTLIQAEARVEPR